MQSEINSEMIFIQGRHVAKTYKEALCKLENKLSVKGYKLAGKTSLYPAKVQPYVDTWWEWQVSVELIVGCVT